MSTTNIQLLRSNILSKRPAASVLLDGQVAVNYNFQEPGLFFRLTNGKLTKVGPVAYSDDGSFPNAVAAGEPGNAVGEQWLDARLSYDNPLLKVYDGTKWNLSNGFEVNDATGNLSLERELSVTILHAQELDLNGPLVLSHDLLAKDNCIQNIGSELNRFHEAWFCTSDVKNLFRVGGNATFDSGLVSGGSVYINDALTVTGITTLKGDTVFERKQHTIGLATFDYNVGIAGILTAAGDASIGSSCTNTLKVNAASTFDCSVNFKDTVTFDKQPLFPSGGLIDSILKGDTVIGDGCATSTLTIKSLTSVECATTFDETIVVKKAILPATDSTIDLGSPTQRFANMYTGDLHLKNDRGDWTMVEEEDYLSLLNNKTGKTYRLSMEEV
jgi:hypothetical protein